MENRDDISTQKLFPLIIRNRSLLSKRRRCVEMRNGYLPNEKEIYVNLGHRKDGGMVFIFSSNPDAAVEI